MKAIQGDENLFIYRINGYNSDKGAVPTTYQWCVSNSNFDIVTSDIWEGTLQLDKMSNVDLIFTWKLPLHFFTGPGIYYLQEIFLFFKEINDSTKQPHFILGDSDISKELLEDLFYLIKLYAKDEMFHANVKNESVESEIQTEIPTAPDPIKPQDESRCPEPELEKKETYDFVKDPEDYFQKELEPKKEDLKYRMYGFVPYQLSGIQSGIQFGHGVVEYCLEFGHEKSCQTWSERDKTFIVLNGGTTNSNIDGPIGTMNKILTFLVGQGIKYSTFHEPDLGNQLTAITFLLDERIWDHTMTREELKFRYSDFGNPLINIIADDYSITLEEAYKILLLRRFISNYKLAN